MVNEKGVAESNLVRIIKHGGDVYLKNNDGYTPLHMMIKAQHETFGEMLLAEDEPEDIRIRELLEAGSEIYATTKVND